MPAASAINDHQLFLVRSPRRRSRDALHALRPTTGIPGLWKRTTNILRARVEQVKRFPANTSISTSNIGGAHPWDTGLNSMPGDCDFGGRVVGSRYSTGMQMPMLIDVGKGQTLLIAPDRPSVVLAPCRWVPGGAIKEPLHVPGLTALRQDYHEITTKPFIYHGSLLDFVMVCCGLHYPLFSYLLNG